MVYNVYIEIKGVLKMANRRKTVTLSLNDGEEKLMKELVRRYKEIQGNNDLIADLPDSVILKSILKKIAIRLEDGEDCIIS